jgi:hypothetical protein
VNHLATSQFWERYARLPQEVRSLADKAFVASIQEDRIGLPARVGLHYRALAIENHGAMMWFWIGSHAEYDHLMR